MKVARNDPAMPRTTVRINPHGLFGPSARKRAMIPATPPIRMIHKMPPMMKLLMVSGDVSN
jgi:hypothetical protein